MTVESFSINWDYRCPFARNAHEHVVRALQAGAGWTVEFLPFSLTQVHVPDGQPPIWDDPSKQPDLLALQAGVVVRDRYPDRFYEAHLALFAARHEHKGDLRDAKVVEEALRLGGISEVKQVFEEIENGWPLAEVRKAHEWSVESHQAWGVPTFIAGGQAAFVRLMNRPDGDPQPSIDTVNAVLDQLVGHPELNEFKHTSIPA